jgi:hypothetical protein
MAVRDDQVSALRAYLAGDFDTYKRLHGKLDPDAARTGYSALVSAAFCEAVERRFSTGTPPADVIKFVGDIRARSDRLGEQIDPRAAERMIRAVYTDEEIRDLDPSTRLGTQVVLLAALIADEQLDAASLEEFLAGARDLADQWIG